MNGLEKIQNSLINLQRNKLFESIVITIIVISALAIGAKTYTLTPELKLGLEWLDLAVTIFNSGVKV